MAKLVLALDVVFLAVAFGLRTFLQWRRTGDSGWRLGRPSSRAEGAARGLLFGSAGLLLASALATPHESLSLGPLSAVGLVAAVSAVTVVVAAQLQMGESWRIGVDPAERTELVRAGLYRWIRNPIYSGMVLFAAGQALMTPGIWSLAAVAAMAFGVEIQVRAVEEPYLRATHGQRYAKWAAQAGRFAPWVGRVRG